MNWEQFFEDKGDEDIMLHHYPEESAGRINVEEMYQAFKARLLEEVSKIKVT